MTVAQRKPEPTADPDGWVSRLESLQVALTRMKREDLVGSLLTPLLSLAADRDAKTHLDVIRDGAQEIRACIVDGSRTPDPAVIGAIDERLAKIKLDGDLLDGFAGAQDDDLDEVLSCLDEDAPPARSAPRDGLGTLRESLDRNSTAQVLMKGEIQPGLLSDLIQMFSQNAETGRVVVKGQSDDGSIFFEDGVIVDATCGEQTGEAGFFGVMCIQQGRFSYERGVTTSQKRIFRSAQHLIMETLRLQDEMEHG